MLQIPRKVIDTAIKEHFESHFNPQSPQMDHEFEFEYKPDNDIFKIYVPYTNCQINIYDDKEISVQCMGFSIDFEIEGVETTLVRDLIVLEENLMEQYEIECYNQRQEDKTND